MKLIREAYLQKIRPYYDADLIKVITGVRRAGKSILLDTIKEELLQQGIDKEHIIYIFGNFFKDFFKNKVSSIYDISRLA